MSSAKTSGYFNPLSWALSHSSFVLTHVTFTYWLIYILNDPFNFGLNTVDFRTAKSAATCTPVIAENLRNNLLRFVLLWWLPHSGFARKIYKVNVGLWHHPIERPLFATIAWVGWLANIHFWQPISNCQHWAPEKTPLWLAAVAVPVFVVGAVFLVGLLWSLPDHVFGTQKCRYAPGKVEEYCEIVRGFPYGLVRHPAAAGFLYMYWSVAVAAQTYNHFFLAAIWSVFIVVGTSWEEGGLRGSDEFGQKYVAYRKEVSAFVPNVRSLKSAVSGQPVKKRSV